MAQKLSRVRGSFGRDRENLVYIILNLSVMKFMNTSYLPGQAFFNIICHKFCTV